MSQVRNRRVQVLVLAEVCHEDAFFKATSTAATWSDMKQQERGRSRCAMVGVLSSRFEVSPDWSFSV